MVLRGSKILLIVPFNATLKCALRVRYNVLNVAPWETGGKSAEGRLACFYFLNNFVKKQKLKILFFLSKE